MLSTELAKSLNITHERTIRIAERSGLLVPSSADTGVTDGEGFPVLELSEEIVTWTRSLVGGIANTRVVVQLVRENFRGDDYVPYLQD